MRSFEFILTHTVVAGLNTPASATGYNIDPAIGSINPLGFPDVFGTAVSRVFNNAAGALDIQMLAALNAGFWQVLKFQSTDGNWDGRTLRSEDFTFTQPGGFATWTLAAQPNFVNGITYLLDWT